MYEYVSVEWWSATLRICLALFCSSLFHCSLRLGGPHVGLPIDGLLPCPELRLVLCKLFFAVSCVINLMPCSVGAHIQMLLDVIIVIHLCSLDTGYDRRHAISKEWP